MEKKKIKHKNSTYFFIALMVVLLLMVGYLVGYYFGTRDVASNPRLYTMCRQFDFMTYLETETLRHYQNASYEVSAMPNCEVYKNNLTDGISMSYDLWLDRNNLTHINWTLENTTGVK